MTLVGKPAIITSGGIDFLNKKFEYFNEELPAAGQVDIAGPAPGFIRIFDTVQIVANVQASPIAASAYGVVRSGGVDYRVTPNLSGAFTLGSNTNFIIGNGEVVRFYNPGATVGRIFGTYIDIKNVNITLIRLTINNVLKTLIPEPSSASFYNRLLQYWTCQFTTRTIHTKSNIFNADTVTHNFRLEMNGNVIGRTTNTTTLNNASTWPNNLNIPVTFGGGDMEIRTEAAITTTEPILVGAYETLRA